MRDLGLYDLAGDPPDPDGGLIECPWCSGWHSADDDLCPFLTAVPADGAEIHEEDIDWDDWIGEVA
ncbi:hypothetical protein [Gordonia sp. NPDC003376]